MRLLNVRIPCSNLENSIRFYEALGFEMAARGERVPNPAQIDAQSPGAKLFGVQEGNTVRLADLRFPSRNPGTHLQLLEISAAAAGSASSPAPLLSVTATADLDTALNAMTQVGGRVEMSPTAFSQLGDLKVATIRDPDGNLIQLVEPTPGAVALRNAAREFHQADARRSAAPVAQAVRIEDW
jgi:catechol 2,3-dioxygenase-like lactoylglutathione lyase family enzyme